MKFFKSILLTLTAVLLTGCYTQLQYTKTFSEKAERGQVHKKSAKKSHYESEYADENNVPIYYKDYDYIDQWDACGCNPYLTYNFYGDSYFGYPGNYYGSGFWYDNYDYGFSVSLYFRWFHDRYFSPWHRRSWYYYTWWGSGFHPRYYSPYYYGFYGYGYPSVFAYNYINYYNVGGYGYGDYTRRNNDVRYGPRSIGANRTSANVTRSRSSSDVSRRGTAINTRSRSNDRSTVRSRSSVGTARTRGTVKRNAGSTNGESRSRVRGNDQVKKERNGRTNVTRGTIIRNSGTTVQRNRSRIRSSNSSGTVNRTRGAIIRENREKANDISRVRSLNSNDLSRQWIINNNSRLQKARNTAVQNRRKPTFFNRIRGILNNATGPVTRNIKFGKSTSTRSRFGTVGNSKSTVKRSSSSSKNRGTVTRSRSSSSSGKARSRGSSTRSRSGKNDNSSGRSRGNG